MQAEVRGSLDEFPAVDAIDPHRQPRLSCCEEHTFTADSAAHSRVKPASPVGKDRLARGANAESRTDGGGHSVRILVLPEPQDGPALVFQEAIRLAVSLPIGHDLRTPVRGIGLRWSVVLGTPVPEAAIDEHRYPRPGENDVGAPTSVDHRRSEIDTVSQAARVQETSHGQLRRRVPTPVAAHRRAGSGAGRPSRSSRTLSVSHPPIVPSAPPPNVDSYDSPTRSRERAARARTHPRRPLSGATLPPLPDRTQRPRASSDPPL